MRNFNRNIKRLSVKQSLLVRQERVTNLKEKLIIASGSEKIELREELAQAVADKAKSIGKEYEVILKNTQQEFEDEVASLAKEIINGA